VISWWVGHSPPLENCKSNLTHNHQYHPINMCDCIRQKILISNACTTTRIDPTSPTFHCHSQPAFVLFDSSADVTTSAETTARLPPIVVEESMAPGATTSAVGPSSLQTFRVSKFNDGRTCTTVAPTPDQHRLFKTIEVRRSQVISVL
jgi:hypothetical protein